MSGRGWKQLLLGVATLVAASSQALPASAVTSFGNGINGVLMEVTGPNSQIGFKYSRGIYVGYVGARGLVTQEVDGQQVPVWAEYAPDQLVDPGVPDHFGQPQKLLLGGVVLWQQPAAGDFKDAFVMSRPEYDANVAAYETLVTQHADELELYSTVDYAQALFLDAQGHPIEAPALASGTTHVAVRKQAARVSDAPLILEQFTLNPLKATKLLEANPEQNFLICKQDACLGNVLHSSASTIAHLSDFIEMNDLDDVGFGFCDPEPNKTLTFNDQDYYVRFDKGRFGLCAPARIKRMLSPIVGAVVRCSYPHIGITDAAGKYSIHYQFLESTAPWYFQTPTFVDTIYTILEFGPFDPRVPLRNRHLAYTLAGSGNVRPQANIGVQVALMQATATMTNEVKDGVPVEPPEPIVRFDDDGNVTTYSYARPSYTPRREFKEPIEGVGGASGNEKGEGGGGGEGGSRERKTYSRFLPESDAAVPQGEEAEPAAREDEVYHRGLVSAISRADMTDKTELYLFSPGGSKITERLQLKLFETPGVECDPYSTENCRVTTPGVQAGFRLQEFIPNNYPGARMKVVAINRATGYLATGYVTIDVGAGVNNLAPLTAKTADGKPLVMRPPNLVIKAERTRLSRTESLGATSIIGFEGGALTEDPVIKLTTEWRDSDGTPLPADMPGLTGRITREVKTNELGPIDARPEANGGQFTIKPGLGTHFLRLPDVDAAVPESYHYYVHVSGQRPDSCQGAGCVDFSTSPDAKGPLAYRPQRYVPFKVPVFDEIATHDALQTNIELARQHQGNGPGKNVVAKVEPIYTNVYRPEYQFSVFDLRETSTEIVTTYDPKLNRGVSKLDFGYSLGTWSSLDPVDPFGPGQNLLWGIGYHEILAVTNESKTEAVDDLDALVKLSPAAQLQEVKDVVDKLDPSDYLGLELYLDTDRGNPLYSQPQLYPLLLASPTELNLTRRQLVSTWGDKEAPPTFIDDYRALPFQVTRPADVEFVLRDAKGNGPIVISTSSIKVPGTYYAVIATNMEIGEKKVPSDFILSLEATEEGETDRFVQKVQYAVSIQEERVGNLSGQIIEHDVNIVDGSVSLQRPEFSLPGRGPRLQLLRSYTSAGSSTAGLMGPGWSHSFSYSMVPLTFGDDLTGSVPKWVVPRVGKVVAAAEVEPFLFPEVPNKPSTMLVNGIVFRMLENRWTPERGRHGKLEVEDGKCVPGGSSDPDEDEEDEEDAPPPQCFVYHALDGTTYRYPSPVARLPKRSTLGTKPTMLQFEDSLYTRLGVGAGDLRTDEPTGKPASPGEVADSTSVAAIADVHENRMFFAYDSKGYLESVTDATERSCAFVYAPNPSCVTQYEGKKRRLYQVRCQDGPPSGSAPIIAQADYCYDADGNLTEAESNGRGELYGYVHHEYANPKGLADTNLTRITTRGGRVTSFSFTTEEAPIEVGLKPGNQVYRRELVNDVNLPAIANGDGSLLNPTVSFKYEGSMRTVTNLYGPGGVTKSYRLNQYGNPLSLNEARGKVTEFSWSVDGGVDGVENGIAVEGDNVLLRRRVQQKQGTFIETLYQYDAQGRVEREVTPAAEREVTQSWNDLGQLTLRQDTRGVSHSWDYDADSGFLKSYTDPRGFVTTFTPDASHLGLASQMTVVGSDPSFAVQFGYDKHGNPSSSTIVGSEGAAHLTTYDARGRLTAETDARGNTISYGYTEDLLTSIVYPGLAPTDCSEAVPPASVQRGYDADGLLEFEIDRNGQRMDYAYTGDRLVSSITRRSGPAESSPPEGTRTFTYDRAGSLLEETDWEGFPIVHTYDELGFRLTTTNRTEHVMTIVPDLLGNALEITDFGGLVTTFTYDLFNRETSRTPVCPNDNCAPLTTRYVETGGNAREAWSIQITDAAGLVTDNFYDAAGNLVRRNDVSSKDSFFEYDAQNRLIKITDEDEHVTEIQYDARGHRKAIIDKGQGGGEAPLRVELTPDPNGNVMLESRWRQQGDNTTREELKTDFDAWNRPFKRSFGPYSECLAYDNEGRLIRQERSVDGKTLERTWQRDTLGRVQLYTDSEAGQTQYLDYDLNGLAHTILDAANHETNLSFDEEGRPRLITEGSGARSMTFVERDGMGNPKEVEDYNEQTWNYDYTSRHLLKQITPPIEQDRPTKFSYTARGEIETITDPAGYVRKHEYYPNGKLYRTNFPTESSLETEYTYTSAGRPLLETRLGVTIENTLDGYGRPKEVHQYSGNGAKVRIAEQKFDDVGNVIKVTDANDYVTQYGFDNRNLLTSTTFPDGSVEGRAYWNTGALRRVDLPTSQSGDTASAITFEYDNEGRLTSRTLGGETTSWTYDDVGFRTSETSPKGQSSGKRRTFTPDALNRLHKVEDEEGVTTTYEYDENDNLRFVTGPGSTSTEYVYDALNRQTEQTDTIGGTAVTTSVLRFDGHGNPELVSKGSGVTTYRYDHYDRPTLAEYPPGESGTYQPIDTTWLYDDVAKTTTIAETKSRPNGEMPTLVDNTFETYDTRSGQLRSSQQRGVTIGYQYYTNGDLLSVTSPGGTTSYEYDGRHVPVRATIDGLATTNYDYFADGRIRTITRPSSTSRYSYWDGTRRPRRIQHTFGAGHTSSVDYSYDKNGNVTNRIDAEDGAAEVTAFVAYDQADRLLQFTQDGNATTYTYENYNRKTELVKRGAVTLANREYNYEGGVRLASIDDSGPIAGTTTFSYDDDGNNSGISVSSAPNERAIFSYDCRSQLVRAVRGPPSAERVVGLYDYNSQGQRIRHELSDRGDVEAFVAPNGALVDERIDGTELNHYHRGFGLLAQVGPNGKELFYQDAQGSVMNLASDTGVRSASLRYDPWGNVRSSEGTPGSNAYRYTGQILDEEAGLYYYGARYYNPKVGRFQSPDSYLGDTSLPESLQRYTYVYNNPATLVDPTGHFVPVGVLIGVGVAAFLAASAPNYADAPQEEVLLPNGELGPSPTHHNKSLLMHGLDGVVTGGAFAGAAAAAAWFGLSGAAAAAFEGGASTFPLKGYEQITTDQSFTVSEYLYDAGFNALLGWRIGRTFDLPGSGPRKLLTAEARNGAVQAAREVADDIPAVIDLRSTILDASELRRQLSYLPDAPLAQSGTAGAMLDRAYDVAGTLPRGRTMLSNELGSNVARRALDDVAVAAEGATGNGRAYLGPHFDEASRLHALDPDFFPDPETTVFRVTEGAELRALRAEFEASGKLGHHRHPLVHGGPAVPTGSGLVYTGESTIAAAKLEGHDLSFYSQYGTPGAKKLKIYQPEPGGIFMFGLNERHTAATTFFNKVSAWQRATGVRR